MQKIYLLIKFFTLIYFSYLDQVKIDGKIVDFSFRVEFYVLLFI